MANHSCTKCRTCKYRAAEMDVHGCDYALITRHSRGCDVIGCDKYEKGKKIKAERWRNGNEYAD